MLKKTCQSELKNVVDAIIVGLEIYDVIICGEPSVNFKM